jgi:hypothetical protein
VAKRGVTPLVFGTALYQCPLPPTAGSHLTHWACPERQMSEVSVNVLISLERRVFIVSLLIFNGSSNKKIDLFIRNSLITNSLNFANSF